jgi:serine/threonine protein kinase
VGAPGEEFGPYIVYEQLGLGGMATVHRAETQGIAGFRKPVALKRMLPSIAANADQVQSFIREARLASHLHHANVAQTYELGKVGDVYFIAMELVTGRNLREILAHCANKIGPMPLPLALNILNQVCDALDYAHNLCDEAGQPLGIIHRDVSPANVIVSETGVCKLIDFGIAKASARGMQTTSRTIKGKFAYMAPEYIAGHIDARADLFAAGVIAHEILANRPLFQGKDEMATLENVRTMPISPPSAWRPDVPPEVDSIVMTALERDPERRWQRAHALREALTAETKRLGLVALNQQVVAWLERVFPQPKRAEISEPSIAITEGMVMPSGDTDSVTGSDVAETLLFRPSAPQFVSSRPSSPHIVRRGELSVTPRSVGTPGPVKVAPLPQGNTTLPGAAAPPVVLPPPPIAPLPRVVNAPKHEDEPSIGGVLRQLESTDASLSHQPTNVSAAKPRGWGILYAFLVLAIAAATAAVVYFVLPYFT